MGLTLRVTSNSVCLQLPKFYPSILNHVLALNDLASSSSALLPLSLLSHPWRSPTTLRIIDPLSFTVRCSLIDMLHTCFTYLPPSPLSPSLPLSLSPSSHLSPLSPSLPLSLSPSLPLSLPPSLPPSPPSPLSTSPQPSIPYHTSALLASALETATLFYRTEHNLTSLPFLTDTLTTMGRKVQRNPSKDTLK